MMLCAHEVQLTVGHISICVCDPAMRASVQSEGKLPRQVRACVRACVCARARARARARACACVRVRVCVRSPVPPTVTWRKVQVCPLSAVTRHRYRSRVITMSADQAH
eukprot:5841500-Amphidinium_carterae.1